MPKVTISQIAKEAGVSKTAVSFAFNDSSQLSSSTLRHIREIAERLGYTPDPIARSMTTSCFRHSDTTQRASRGTPFFFLRCLDDWLKRLNDRMKHLETDDEEQDQHAGRDTEDHAEGRLPVARAIMASRAPFPDQRGLEFLG